MLGWLGHLVGSGLVCFALLVGLVCGWVGGVGLVLCVDMCSVFFFFFFADVVYWWQCRCWCCGLLVGLCVLVAVCC